MPCGTPYCCRASGCGLMGWPFMEGTRAYGFVQGYDRRSGSRPGVRAGEGRRTAWRDSCFSWLLARSVVSSSQAADVNAAQLLFGARGNHRDAFPGAKLSRTMAVSPRCFSGDAAPAERFGSLIWLSATEWDTDLRWIMSAARSAHDPDQTALSRILQTRGVDQCACRHAASSCRSRVGIAESLLGKWTRQYSSKVTKLFRATASSVA